ncbi:MAG: hypothetical protein FJ134_04915 [Deltaproteobacteria bacterium]|nr:hypothetical protein [Deltaproteobacteria bacterium]
MQIGTIWVIIGYFVIAGGLLVGSLMVHYGNKINQQASEQKIAEQQKETEAAIRSDLIKLKIEISKLQNTKRKELNSQFPSGYQLFGIINNNIIPSQNPSSEEIKISWSTAKILSVTKDLISIRLPDAVFPGNSQIKDCIIRIKNKEGATSSSIFVINGWHSYLKILKSEENKIIAAVGYVKK